MSWSYGVTTVFPRLNTLLPATLASLAKAGFNKPTLFVDGTGLSTTAVSCSKLVHLYEQAFPTLSLTFRQQAVKCHAAWWLAFQELFLQDPGASYYALFQDDCAAYLNLCSYLERRPCPDDGYMNLYTATPGNEHIIRQESGQEKPVGWYEGVLKKRLDSDPSTYPWQLGIGAVGLVFPRKAAYALLTSPKMIEHACDKTRGWRKVDGAIVNAMNQAGFREYIHNPSLLQHTGDHSTTGSMPMPYAATFLGEKVDALGFLKT